MTTTTPDKPRHPGPCAGPGCNKCDKAANDPRYQKLWGLPVTARPKGSENAIVNPLISLRRRLRPACKYLGTATGEERECETCTGKLMLPVHQCSVHGLCTTEKFVPGLACCAVCNDRDTGGHAEDENVLQVVATANGVGDHVLGLTAVAGLKANNPQATVVMVCKPWCVGWASLFDAADYYTTTPIQGAKTLRPYDTYDAQIRDRTARPRWEYYAEACKTTAVLPSHKPLNAGAMAWAKQYAGCVVLSPFSTDTLRTWSLAHWLTLESLLNKAGLQTVVIDHGADRLAPFRGHKVAGESPVRVAALLYLASAMVGNDSGMTHVAGMMRTPTVALTASIPGDMLFGIYPTVRVVQGPLDCGNCHGRDRGDRGGLIRQQIGCHDVCFNLQAITPEAVFGVVADLTWWPARQHTLLTPDRLAVLRRVARECSELPGDFVELGCYLGGSAMTIAHAAPRKRLRLFDTFAGLPEDDAAGGGPHRVGEFACGLDEVSARLSGLDVEFHPGFFPETAAAVADREFAFVHLDADLYSTTRAALEFFWPRMVPGGAVVLDDFNWKDCPGVARAVSEVIGGADVRELVLHQAVARKPR